MKILAWLGLIYSIGTACAAQNNYKIPTSITECLNSSNNTYQAIGMIALALNDGDELAAIRSATNIVTGGILNPSEESFTSEGLKKYSIDFFNEIYKDKLFANVITNYTDYLQIHYKNMTEDYELPQGLVNQSTNFDEFINWLNDQSIRIDPNGKITIGSTTLEGNYAGFAKDQMRSLKKNSLAGLLEPKLTENVLSLLDKEECSAVKPNFICLTKFGFGQEPESVKKISELLEQYQAAILDPIKIELD